MRQRFVLYLLSLIIFLQLITGCDKNNRYRTLVFFFDGVPAPEGVKKEVVPVLANISGVEIADNSEQVGRIRYMHPAAEGKDDCSFCHSATTDVFLPPKNACLKCHEHLRDTRPFVHGPAASDCVVCHNVHVADTKELLRIKGNLLCFVCHQQETLIRGKGHEGVIENSRSCLSCHDPHGGKNKSFLR